MVKICSRLEIFGYSLEMYELERASLHEMVVLVLDYGVAHALYSEISLKEVVEEVVLKEILLEMIVLVGGREGSSRHRHHNSTLPFS